MFGRHVSIDLSCCERSVSEHHLYCDQGSAVVEHVSSKSMAQNMRMAKALFYVLAEHLEDCRAQHLGGELRAIISDKQERRAIPFRCSERNV